MSGYRPKFWSATIARVHIQHIQGSTFRAFMHNEEGQIIDIREVSEAAKNLGILTVTPAGVSGVEITADWPFDAGKARTVHSIAKKAIAAYPPDIEGAAV